MWDVGCGMWDGGGAKVAFRQRVCRPERSVTQPKAGAERRQPQTDAVKPRRAQGQRAPGSSWPPSASLVALPCRGNTAVFFTCPSGAKASRHPAPRAGTESDRRAGPLLVEVLRLRYTPLRMTNPWGEPRPCAILQPTIQDPQIHDPRSTIHDPRSTIHIGAQRLTPSHIPHPALCISHPTSHIPHPTSFVILMHQPWRLGDRGLPGADECVIDDGVHDPATVPRAGCRSLRGDDRSGARAAASRRAGKRGLPPRGRRASRETRRALQGDAHSQPGRRHRPGPVMEILRRPWRHGRSDRGVPGPRDGERWRSSLVGLWSLAQEGGQVR